MWRRAVKLLLDTHALVWWIRGDPQLSEPARTAIMHADADVYVSMAVAWEIAIKIGAKGWPEARPLLEQLEVALVAEGFSHLPISINHVRMAGLMNAPHRDPFDRLLAAQATIENMKLVSADAGLVALGVPIMW